MSAVVCGKRSNLFEDFQSPPKKTRCSSFSPATLNHSFADHLLMLFPDMDKQVRISAETKNTMSIFPSTQALVDRVAWYLLLVRGGRYPVELVEVRASWPGHHGHQKKKLDNQCLGKLVERTLGECGDDLDFAIKSLNELRLGSFENLRHVAGSSGATQESSSQIFTQGAVTSNGDTTHTKDLSAAKVRMEGTEWVELFVREMMSASNVDDAKARASRALEVLEKSICARATEATACSFQQEKIMLKQQLEALVQENAILKRAVAIQYERQKEFEDRGHELNQLKQSVVQYQEQLRTLEVTNYTLSMHLKQAQQSNSIPGHFHPDVF